MICSKIRPEFYGVSATNALDFLIWWGIFLIALSAPGSWWTVLSPIVITAVLLKMTGIPLTEQELVKKRPEYLNFLEDSL